MTQDHSRIRLFHQSQNIVSASEPLTVISHEEPLRVPIFVVLFHMEKITSHHHSTGDWESELCNQRSLGMPWAVVDCEAFPELYFVL